MCLFQGYSNSDVRHLKNKSKINILQVNWLENKTKQFLSAKSCYCRHATHIPQLGLLNVFYVGLRTVS